MYISMPLLLAIVFIVIPMLMHLSREGGRQEGAAAERSRLENEGRLRDFSDDEDF